MPSDLTTVTELATGLGMLGDRDVDTALARRPAAMVSLSPELWDRLQGLREGGAHDAAFEAAFANGAAFLRAAQGLRGRSPLTVEWKGSQRAPGDEVAPVDLRVDHVYLVSCKYLSRILRNSSPAHLFSDLLAGPPTRRGGDWYVQVAPDPYRDLYQRVRQEVGPSDLPARMEDLDGEDRARLRHALRGGWPAACRPAYAELARAVSEASARCWEESLASRGGAAGRSAAGEAMLWRLLRMGSAPYFVLGAGTGGAGPLRLRVATPWDWRQHYRLASLTVWPQDAGQPLVGWSATVRDRLGGGDVTVQGHVEVRWSHGRLAGAPEAKVYLDTPHHQVPGYFTLT